MHITWDADSAEKGGYKHFMKKEIAEQPRAVRDTLSGRIVDGRVHLPELSLGDEQIKNIGVVHIVACGSAWHVGMTAKYLIERSAGILCECDLASEFRYRHPVVRENDLCVVISQSGETADTLAALREAKSRGAHTVSIVNVVESTIARESDDVIYTVAGPEIAVATTKAFSAQLAAVYLLALRLSSAVGRIDEKKKSAIATHSSACPSRLSRCSKTRSCLSPSQSVSQRRRAYSSSDADSTTLFPSRLAQAQGDILYQVRGLRRRRIEARHDIAHRAGHPRVCRRNPARPL